MRKTEKFRVEIEPSIQNEKELVQQTLLLLPEFLKGYELEWSVEQEVGVGRAIADLVILLRPKRRPRAPQGLLTIAESVVLSSLRRSGRTRIDLLEKRCGLPQQGLRGGSLDRLRTWGILQDAPGGVVEIAGVSTAGAQIIALEAKLSRWRDALTQARAYRRYADRAYVVLPEAAAERALKSREEFESDGIGLLGVSGGRLVLLLEAELCTTHDWRREFVFSRLIASQ